LAWKLKYRLNLIKSSINILMYYWQLVTNP
jgi:hypothetical protein